MTETADHDRTMQLVAQLSPETRTRFAGRLDDRFHEITGTVPVSAPTRIQRRRTKGWRKPENTVIVSRPSRFGNPCKVSLMQEMGYLDPHAAAAANFATWLRGDRFEAPTDEADRRRERILLDLPSLRGRDLACTCRPDQVCHADELLNLANLPESEQREWIAGVRARVDRQRVVRGEEPMYAVRAEGGAR